MIQRLGYFIAVMTVTVAAHAEFMCPTTYKYVNIGDSEGQVLASCGDPVSKKKSEHTASENVALETLVFAIPNGNADARYELTFADSRLIRIKSETGESETIDTCRGEPMRLGASIYDVISNCGTPVNRYSGQVQGAQTTVKAEDWFYRFGTTQVKMRFIEGALHDINPDID